MSSAEFDFLGGFPSPAFVFDLDGVIVDSERTWRLHAPNFQIELYGQEIARKLGHSTIGMSRAGEYEMALRAGFTLERSEFFARYDRQAIEIYSRARLTPGLDRLIDQLRAACFQIGLVTASPPSWIDCVLQRASFRNQFGYIISLEGRSDLRPKPYPDGYLEAMRHLGARPETTIIIEDSNHGICAAKAAGALTIGFRGNLVPGYEQVGADLYADTMGDVLDIVKAFPFARR